MRVMRMVAVGLAALTAAVLVPRSARAESEPVDVVRLCTHRSEPTDAPVDPMVVTVNGTLPCRETPEGWRYLDSEYVLRLQRGQTFTLRVNGFTASTVTLAVTSPSGRTVKAYEPGMFVGAAEETGDHRIHVGNGRMFQKSAQGSDSFKLFVEVEAETASCKGAEHFDRYVGQDPSDFFRTEPGVRSRLRKLLKKDYREFMDRIQTTGLIYKQRGAVMVEGFRLHLSSIASRLAIKDGKFTAALVDDDKIRTFSEDPAHPFSF